MGTLQLQRLATPADEREIIHVPQVGEEETGISNQIPRSILIGIVQPRLEETFELVRSRLESSGFDKIAGRRVVLTGGGSQLNGAREVAARILSKQVRLGRPSKIVGLAEATGGAAFSNCAGLALWAANRPGELLEERDVEDDMPRQAYGTYGLAGITRWFRENF